ncbi:MAG TPA: hypothetical protein VD713_03040 [Sphingomonadales bacterium]|nr:hypothetical protein [Sphingomonadales bacterium]
MFGSALIVLFSILSAAAVFTGVFAVRNAPLRPALAFAAGLFLAFLVSLALPTAPAFLSNALVLAGAVGLGVFISFFLTSNGAIAAFCVAVGVVDYFSFKGGLTAKLIAAAKAGNVDLLKHLVIYLPQEGGRLTALIGVGDLVILGALYAGLMENRHSPGAALFAPTAGLVFAILTGLVIGGVYGVPFISVAVLLYLYVRPLYGVVAGLLYLAFLFLVLPSLV